MIHHFLIFRANHWVAQTSTHPAAMQKSFTNKGIRVFAEYLCVHDIPVHCTLYRYYLWILIFQMRCQYYVCGWRKGIPIPIEELFHICWRQWYNYKFHIKQDISHLLQHCHKYYTHQQNCNQCFVTYLTWLHIMNHKWLYRSTWSLDHRKREHHLFSPYFLIWPNVSGTRSIQYHPACELKYLWCLFN